jgi:transcriptional regulator with XRE-family HTH domain
VKRLNTERLEKKFAELGLSQSAVAEKLDISREAVSQWMLEKSFPRPKVLLELSGLSGLSFNELVVADPEPPVHYAYRTNRNSRVSEDLRSRAEEIFSVLVRALAYFPFESAFMPPLLSNPKNDEAYISRVAAELRRGIGCFEGAAVQEQSLLAYFDKLQTIIVPVLWGDKGPDALHVGMEGNSANFIYINVQKKMCDIKYWMVHELAHLLTPGLAEAEAETFADALAAAVLYPDAAAFAFASRVERAPTPAAIVSIMLEEASTFGISPITVWKRTTQLSRSRGISIPEVGIFGAAANYTKSVESLAEVLFGEEMPSIEKYIIESRPWFGSRFFDGLARYLVVERKGATAVQQILGMSVGDAKGVWEYLVHL